MSDNLSLSLARRRVEDYIQTERHRADDAESRLICESRVQQGLDSYRWLRRAEETMREAAYEGLFELDDESRDLLEKLYGDWLEFGEITGEQLQDFQSRNVTITGSGEFREALEWVRNLVSNCEWLNLTGAARHARDLAEEW